jgi:hypothetical protein
MSIYRAKAQTPFGYRLYPCSFQKVGKKGVEFVIVTFHYTERKDIRRCNSL